MKKVIHAFFSKKVVEIDGKMYSSLEKIPPIGSDSDDMMIIVREVELKESKYNHPVKGALYNYAFNKINTSPKRYMSLERWEELENINKADFSVHTASSM